MRNLLPLILLFVFAQAQSAQVIRGAEKIDQFGKLGCCDFEARIGNFYVRLNSDQNVHGYIMISGDNLGQRLHLERFILDTIAEQHFDRERVTIIREEQQGSGPEVTFWAVPEGADKPQVHEVSLDFTFARYRKPFLFEANTEDSGICPLYSLDLGHLSEFLAANPSARANIVISSGVNTKEHRELRSKLQRNAAKVNLPTNKLRFFGGETRPYSTVEIWLVPGKKP